MSRDGNGDVRECLKNLIHGSTLEWSHAILWQRFHNEPVLKFVEGYYRGTGKQKEIRILGSSVTVTEQVIDAESEWFFKISMSQSIDLEDLPGHAYIYLNPIWIDGSALGEWGRWERSKWGHDFGIRTFFCIRLEDERVLELASTHIILFNPLRMSQIRQLIDPIGTPWSRCSRPEALYERGQMEIEIDGNKNLSKLSRGKEKISNSKRPWSLLTESSERTFSCSHDYSGPS
ncbi:unnamed protein product [Sphenostylis stenocarpa]|uniref:Transcription factor n=1 Tax=Sphenostylis stenocarpa TaxID=92480 RepID=A0AA86T9K8_9FABA|nr:unnamed protein product [Sphenostylis stenocarpa]